MKNVAVLILAAGEGTRMKSERSKVLHEVCGRPMVRWVLSAVRPLKPASIDLIVGHKADQVRAELAQEKISYVTQGQQLGTGHAVRLAGRRLKNFKGDVLVLCADTPLIAADTLQGLLSFHRKRRNAATILSAHFSNPFSYGRIVRLPSGQVTGIVEEKDATPQQRAITEINSGIYCFKSPLIWQALSRVRNDNAKKEYYLTDVIGILDRAGEKVDAFSQVQPDEIMGVNNRRDLSVAEAKMRRAICERHMLEGVTIIDPATTHISAQAQIGRDTVLLPGTIIEGSSHIGAGCLIGPYACIKDSTVADQAEVRLSCVTEAALGTGVKIGPYAHLRPGAVLEAGARVGNFSEVKKSVIGEGAKVNHLSYIGDATIGRKVNIGAGTITCNYDGAHKHRTVIGDRTFVGSNVNLVAPVNIGPDVVLGAGSTITDDVPERSLAIARARQINKERKK